MGKKRPLLGIQLSELKFLPKPQVTQDSTQFSHSEKDYKTAQHLSSHLSFKHLRNMCGILGNRKRIQRVSGS